VTSHEGTAMEDQTQHHGRRGQIGISGPILTHGVGGCRVPHRKGRVGCESARDMLRRLAPHVLIGDSRRGENVEVREQLSILAPGKSMCDLRRTKNGNIESGGTVG
jgi:hypothetical protein